MIRSLRRPRIRRAWIGGVVVGLVWFFWTVAIWEPLRHGFWDTATSFPPVMIGLLAVGWVLAGYQSARHLEPLTELRKSAPDPAPCILLNIEQFRAIKQVGYLLANK